MKRVGFLCALLALAMAVPAWADDIRVSREWLVERLSSQEITILDVRQPYHWSASPSKIKGAQRRDPSKVQEWLRGLAKDKVYVLYCA
jgi:rhodanese-related sulfurtransferase